MVSRSDIKAGAAFVELYVKNTALMRGLSQAQRRLETFGRFVGMFGGTVLAVGTAITAPLVAATKHFMSIGDQLDKMAKRTGMTTFALSELGFAAEQSGTNIAAVETAVRKMQKTIWDAGRGLSTATNAFDKLGISLENLQDLAPDDQFALVADRIAGIDDATQKAAVAMEVFGRSGTAIVPMLADMRDLREEARQLGLSIGPEQARAAADMADAWNRVKRSAGSVFREIGFSAANATALNQMANIIGGLREWVEGNREVVSTVLKIGVGLTVGGAALLAFGKIVSGLGSLLGGLRGVIFVATGGLNLVAGVLGATISPALAIGAALTAAGAALLYLARNTAPVKRLRESIGGFLDDVRSMVSTLAGDVTDAWSGVKAALSAGDIEAAVAVATATAKLEWAKLSLWFEEIWQAMLSVWSGITTGIASTMISTVATIKSAWADGLGWMMKRWAEFSAAIAQTDVGSWMASEAVSLMGLEVSPETIRALGRDLEGKLPGTRAEIDAQTAAEKARIEADRAAMLQALGEGRDAAATARQAEIDAAREELNRARTARDQALAAAYEAQQKAAAKAAGEATRRTADASQRILGTFKGEELRAFGTQSVQERIADGVWRMFQKMGEETTIMRRVDGRLADLNFELAE